MKADSQFIANLADSVPITFRVAQWLAQQGIDVRVIPIVVRPDSNQRMEYGDNGDMDIILRVEVKKRDLDFTNARDYPFSTVIVDETYKVDRATRQFWAYYIVNRSETHVCMVPTRSRKHWVTATRFDKAEGATREFYECPLEHCQFFSLFGEPNS